jgi:hypothetical protein
MNAGTDYTKAKKQAQANADYSKTPRWLHGYNGVWWVSQTPVRDAERIDPSTKPKGYV